MKFAASSRATLLNVQQAISPTVSYSDLQCAIPVAASLSICNMLAVFVVVVVVVVLVRFFVEAARVGGEGVEFVVLARF